MGGCVSHPRLEHPPATTARAVVWLVLGPEISDYEPLLGDFARFHEQETRSR